jgi:hypothetical protein
MVTIRETVLLLPGRLQELKSISISVALSKRSRPYFLALRTGIPSD